MRWRSILAVALLASIAACRGDIPPDTSPEAEAEVVARAVATVCNQICIGTQVPIRDVMAEDLAPPWPGPPLDDVQRQAFTRQFADVEFLDATAADELVSDGGVVVVVSPVVELSESELRVDMAAEDLESGVRDFTQTFRWSGADWVAVDG